MSSPAPAADSPAPAAVPAAAPAPAAAAPALIYGLSSGFPTSPSYLNDCASINAPEKAVFTSFCNVALPGISRAAAFDQLCRPEHAAAVALLHGAAVDFELLGIEEHLVEPVRPAALAGYSDSAALIEQVNARDAWKWAAQIKFVEKVPLLCGLVTKRVHNNAWQVADPEHMFLRYAGCSDGGSVYVFRWRWITEGIEDSPASSPPSSSASASSSPVAPQPEPPAAAASSAAAAPAGPSCTVHEFIIGVIKQKMFRNIAQSECRRMSKLHVAKYVTLPYQQQPEPHQPQEENKEKAVEEKKPQALNEEQKEEA